MEEKKTYLDGNGLLYYDTKYVKGRLSNKVDKELKTNSESEYKVLSDNNLTDELVKKINDAGSSSFDGDYEKLTNKPAIDGKELSSTSTAEDLGLAKKEDIPTDYVSDSELETKGYQTADDVESTLSSKNYATETFVTDKGYQTSEQVQQAINKAVEGISGIDFSIVEQLPDSGKKGIIYLVNNSGSGQNIYDEYIWVEDKFEKIGTTDVDLSQYLKAEDLVAITNSEIDIIIGEA